MNKINVSSFYHTYPNKDKINIILFVKILKTYFRLYGKAIVEGHSLTFLNRLGRFKMVKYWRNMEQLNIDWGLTYRNRKETGDQKMLSYRTNTYYFILEWSRMSGYSFDFKEHFLFKPFPAFNKEIPPNKAKLDIATLNRTSRGHKS